MTSNILKNKSVSFNILTYLKSLALLMKPRVMSLVIFTCTVGLLTSPTSISFEKSIISIFFVTIGAGAAGAPGGRPDEEGDEVRAGAGLPLRAGGPSTFCEN